MSRGTRAVIDLRALQHNFRLVRERAPGSQVLAVVKADGYGHGAVAVAQALREADAFGVATFGEALVLQRAGITQPILLMEGVMSAEELQLAAQHRFQIVVHQFWQLALLQRVAVSQPLVVWLKVDTGMHRLGIPLTACTQVWDQLRACASVNEIRLMSHLACADDADHPLNRVQREGFAALVHTTGAVQSSLANSAGLLRGEAFQFQWVRPGLMLYGATPLAEASAEELSLQPAMQLESRIISTSVVPAGETVGYSATWRAAKDTPIGVVAIGYGDGYPRHVSPEAFVLIKGQRCPLVGRVSMDMLTVDISNVPDATLETPVILWGRGLPVEWVARWAGTINYELLCQVTDRVERIYAAG
ncbi:MAG: alanine racemase [Pseudomonadota bacterium]